jgi:hypothetical protein
MEGIARKSFIALHPIFGQCLRGMGLRNAEELAAEGKVLFATGGGKESVMADSNEAMGQDVQEKASNKLLHIEGHPFLFVGVLGIAPAEDDFAVHKADQPMIGDSDTMRVGAQIIKDLTRAAEGRFGIDDPFGFAGALKKVLELFTIVEFLKRSVKRQFSGGEGFSEAVEEKAAEKTGEDAYGQEEAFPGRDPSLTVGRKAAAWNHAMEVRVKEQILSPGVKHGEKADVGAQVFGIRSNAPEGFRGGAKKDAVNDLLILSGNGSNAEGLGPSPF